MSLSSSMDLLSVALSIAICATSAWSTGDTIVQHRPTMAGITMDAGEETISIRCYVERGAPCLMYGYARRAQIYRDPSPGAGRPPVLLVCGSQITLPEVWETDVMYEAAKSDGSEGHHPKSQSERSSSSEFAHTTPNSEATDSSET
jgi:hypothetical protein